MKKIMFLISAGILLIFSLSSCNNNEVLSDVSPYRIMNLYDKSFLSAKRVEIATYVLDKDTDISVLKKYAEEIIENYKEENHGIMVSFYDVMEETTDPKYIPMAVATWGPKGSFKEAVVYHKYNEKNYNLIIQKNKKIYDPTYEELELYKNFIKLKDLTTAEKIDKLNIKKEDLENFLETIQKIQNRYEEKIKR